MSTKNYYAILGLSGNETPEAIRAAYRDAVRRTHPDHTGLQGATDFHDVVEAYSILSDPDRRQDYDDELQARERDRQGSMRPQGFGVRGRPESTFAERHTGQHPFASWAEQVERSFGGRTMPEVMPVDVVLTPKEAAYGCLLTLRIPVGEECHVCDGTGIDWPFPCLYCSGTGKVETIQSVQVRLPQGLEAGAEPEVSLQRLGINASIRLRIHLWGDEYRRRPHSSYYGF